MFANSNSFGKTAQAHQYYFSHFEPSRNVGRQQEIPEKKHLTTRKQSLARHMKNDLEY